MKINLENKPIHQKLLSGIFRWVFEGELRWGATVSGKLLGQGTEGDFEQYSKASIKIEHRNMNGYDWPSPPKEQLAKLRSISVFGPHRINFQEGNKTSKRKNFALF